MAVLPLLSDEEASAQALAVFNDIRAKRGTDYVNNFWRALAHDPDELQSVWDRLQTVMAPGALDPLVKELIYIAVSATNGCTYCVHDAGYACRTPAGRLHGEPHQCHGTGAWRAGGRTL